MASPNQDPTRTATLRARFASAMRGRYNKLSSEAVSYVQSDNVDLGVGTFFLDDFDIWLNQKEQEIIYENNDANWMRPFAVGAFLAGVRHADRNVRAGLKNLGLQLTMPEIAAQAFQPEIDLIQAQNLRLLTGINEVMNLQIREALTRGILEGENPLGVARLMADRVAKIGRTRAELIARTETIRAHAEASLSRYETWGVSEISGQAEFLTAQDTKVCPECADLEEQVFTVDEAQGIIPVHPRCRCTWLPVITEFDLSRMRINARYI